MKINGIPWWSFAIRCACFPVFGSLVVLSGVLAYLAIMCEKMHKAIDEALPR